jgi:peptidoglycan LD-endopeptidase LytH
MNTPLSFVLEKNSANFHKVVDFNKVSDKLFLINCTSSNQDLTTNLLANTLKFSNYITQQISSANAKYAFGGYGEDRVLYKRSEHFEGTEARSIHLGIDIWGPVGTKVYTPLGGMVHSFAYNDHYGDYGATIILQHQLDTIAFHTLYGHLSKADLLPLQVGKYISRGEVVGHFGAPNENGDWPPHLHFQIIEDMRFREGDYPGVCAPSQQAMYLANCPNPNIILNMV